MKPSVKVYNQLDFFGGFFCLVAFFSEEGESLKTEQTGMAWMEKHFIFFQNNFT